jgi:hypothetical protein
MEHVEGDLFLQRVLLRPSDILVDKSLGGHDRLECRRSGQGLVVKNPAVYHGPDCREMVGLKRNETNQA